MEVVAVEAGDVGESCVTGVGDGAEESDGRFGENAIEVGGRGNGEWGGDCVCVHEANH